VHEVVPLARELLDASVGVEVAGLLIELGILRVEHRELVLRLLERRTLGQVRARRVHADEQHTDDRHRRQ